MIDLGEQSGAGFPRMNKACEELVWKRPNLSEDFETYQTTLTIRAESLFPEGIRQKLEEEFGERFNRANSLERLIFFLLGAEETISHKRIMELSNEHPADVTHTLQKLQKEGIITSCGNKGRGAVYQFINYKTKKLNSKENNSSLFDSINNNSVHNNPESVHSESDVNLGKISNSKRILPQTVESAILDLCKIEARSIEELAVLLNRKENTLRTHYISSLRKKIN